MLIEKEGVFKLEYDPSPAKQRHWKLSLTKIINANNPEKRREEYFVKFNEVSFKFLFPFIIGHMMALIPKDNYYSLVKFGKDYRAATKEVMTLIKTECKKWKYKEKILN